MLYSNRRMKRKPAKKGQGLPISVIIIAAIGLIVLIIVVVMVQRRATIFGTGLKEVTTAKCPTNIEKPIGDPTCDPLYGAYKVKPGYECCRAAAATPSP